MLNIIVFQANNTPLAARQARSLKYFVSDFLAETANKRVNISRFGQPEKILSTAGKQVSLQEGLLVFSKPQMQILEEERI